MGESAGDVGSVFVESFNAGVTYRRRPSRKYRARKSPSSDRESSWAVPVRDPSSRGTLKSLLD